MAPVDQPAAQLAIFRAGTHTSVDGRKLTFTPEVIAELAETYDPSVSEAPLVVGHPKIDAPAYGWAKSLRADGAVLYAEPHQVEPQFAEMVNAGRFKKISAAVYFPTSAGNPKPGKHYIKHIGFLGAAAPSVKGLPSASFAADDEAVEFAAPLGFIGSTLVDIFQRLRDYFVERDGVDAADRIIPQWSIRSLDTATDEPQVASSFAAPTEDGSTPETDMSEQQAAAFAEREQKINTREADVAAREQAIATKEQQARRDDVATFAAQLVTDGKILPRERDSIVEVILALPADTTASFAEGDGTVTKAVGDVLRQFLTALPKRIDFQEKSASADAANAAASFAAPEGLPVDTVKLELHTRAVAYQGEHPNTPYIDAVRAVGG